MELSLPRHTRESGQRAAAQHPGLDFHIHGFATIYSADDYCPDGERPRPFACRIKNRINAELHRHVIPRALARHVEERLVPAPVARACVLLG